MQNEGTPAKRDRGRVHVALMSNNQVAILDRQALRQCPGSSFNWVRGAPHSSGQE